MVQLELTDEQWRVIAEALRDRVTGLERVKNSLDVRLPLHPRLMLADDIDRCEKTLRQIEETGVLR